LTKDTFLCSLNKLFEDLHKNTVCQPPLCFTKMNYDVQIPTAVDVLVK